jgi:glycosyltransferase involved in cell wall biosynthesis
VSGDLSVVIPVRDGAARIADAIESVLEHADGLLEVIVVDDGSQDPTAEVAAAFGPPVRVIRTPPRGVGAARNTGFAAAAGALIGFVDDDDRWLAPTPDPRRRVLAEDPAAIVLGQVVMTPVGGGPLSEPFLLYSFCSALIPRAAAAIAGPVDEALRAGEDLAWFLAARDAGVAIRSVHDVVLHYRRRADSVSTQQPGAGLLAGLASAIRRRAEAP